MFLFMILGKLNLELTSVNVNKIVNSLNQHRNIEITYF
jgi:hypothetical protein